MPWALCCPKEIMLEHFVQSQSDFVVSEMPDIDPEEIFVPFTLQTWSLDIGTL